MKKQITCVVISLVLLSTIMSVSALENQQLSDQIQERMVFSDPTVNEQSKTTRISLSEATSTLLGPDNPQLPIVSKTFILPFGTDIQDVTVRFEETQQYEISYPIVPAPSPRYISDQLNAEPLQETSNIASIKYTENQYPTHQYSMRTGCGLNGDVRVTYVTLHISPFRYAPEHNTLEFSKTATIDITYTNSKPSLFNGDSYDLLILTPSEFQEELQPLVDKKNEVGTQTMLTTLEEIPDTGVDIQEDIKYFIKDTIEEYGITSVLLVGAGVKNYEKFPVRYAWVPSGQYEANFPSDLYYADIYKTGGGFASWDANGNGKYAEYDDDNPEVDIYPDVALGRLPCNDSATVTAVVNKIINYMDHNSMTNTIVQIGGDTFPGDEENINEGEFANEEVLTKLPGYTTTQCWGSTETLTKQNIINAVYDGVDFIDFSGHGSYLSYATHPPNDESRWIPEGSQWNGFTFVEFLALFNINKLPVVFFNACSCNKFSESDFTIGWTPIKKPYGGAIASYGASGIGYGMGGSFETARLFGWMEVHAFEGFYETKVLGEVWQDCISGYTNSFVMEEGDYKTVEEFTLFGDPTLAIEDGTDPQTHPHRNTRLFTHLQRMIQYIPLYTLFVKFLLSNLI